MKKVIFTLLFCFIAHSAVMHAALPDVDLEIIGPAVIDPSEPIFGDKVTITLYLYNYGPEDIKGPIKVDWKINGKSIGQSVTMGLTADEQKEIKNTFKVKDKVNKLRVSISTAMTPFTDSYTDNNIYEEEISLTNLISDEGTSADGGQNTELANDKFANRIRDGKSRVEESSGSSGSQPNTSGKGTSNSSQNTQSSNRTGNNSQNSGNEDKTQGSDQNKNSSNSNTSAKDSKANPNNPNSSPTFDNSELTRLFASYVTSYLKLYTKLMDSILHENDNARKNGLSGLKKDIDALHSQLISLNKKLAGNQSSSRESKTDWNALQELLSKIETQLGNFDELESFTDDYIDNADSFISKLKDSLGE